MSVSSNFRTLCFALRNVAGMDTYAVLNAADAVERTVEGMVAQGIEDYKSSQIAAERARQADIQKVYNLAASTSRKALEEFNNGRKINAIKEIRSLTGASLKVAKDAVESTVFALAADAIVQEQWDEYRDAAENYCCRDCDGHDGPQRPSREPLAEWERELLTPPVL
jgi:ribosomal protein L7/L12